MPSLCATSLVEADDSQHDQRIPCRQSLGLTMRHCRPRAIAPLKRLLNLASFCQMNSMDYIPIIDRSFHSQEKEPPFARLTYQK